MHRGLLLTNIVETSGDLPARHGASWKVIFFFSLFGALAFCSYAHGDLGAASTPAVHAR